MMMMPSNGHDSESSIPPPEQADVLIRAWEDVLGETLAREQAACRRECALIEAQAAKALAEMRAQIIEMRADHDAKLKAWTINMQLAVDERLAKLRDGEPGTKGEKGDVGERGERGLQGPEGMAGETGPAGPAGTGVTGPAGAAGPQGERGTKGERGETGPVGKTGPQGRDGLSITGPIGEIGPRGESGERGEPGISIRGEIGPQGPMGLVGGQGLQGIVGERGERGERGEPGIPGVVGREGAQGPPGRDGLSVAGPEGARGLRGERGERGERGPQGLPGVIGKDGALGPRGERGERGEIGPEGPPGRMLAVKYWTAGAITYRGELVTHAGATWQARCDTSHLPGDDHWICVAAAGLDARSPTVRGTYEPDKQYSALDIVALNGGSFICKRDNPGPCPGDDWQMITRQGQRGIAGEKGSSGERGPQGTPGVSIRGWKIDRAAYVATPVLTDGTIGPPLELRELFEQFQIEVT